MAIGRRRVLTFVAVAATAAVAIGLAPAAATAEPSSSPAASAAPLAPVASPSVSLIRLVVPDQAAVDGLIADGYDLAEYRKPVDGGLEVHVVATPADRQALQDRGYAVVGVVANQTDVSRNRLQRVETISETTQAEAEATDTLNVLRAEWFTSAGQRFLAVEVKTSNPTPENILTVSWNGKTATMSRFTDAGQYMYHRFSTPIPLSLTPWTVTISSTDGARVSAPVTQWLGGSRPTPPKHYVSDFVDHYMDPTEVYTRITKLGNQFDGIADVIDLPYLTNGYRRAAQAQFGTGGSAFYVTTKAYGSEGGNNVTMTVAAPTGPNVPLSVTVTGSAVVVGLASNDAGAASSTAAQVVAALNANPAASALLTAATLRGNAGAGLVAPAALTRLTDNLKAPASVSRQPFQMKALRIGSTRDGSKPGVFLYCQEHAREWVTPLVCVETAERLLRNYSLDPATKKLVDGLDIFIVPSINPDGGHYSFYDAGFQRKNMTNRCDAANGDPGYATSWGVDLNRNFSVGSVYDGFSGASATSCRSGTYAGPAELSEPEAKNEVWLTEQYPNIRFAMNTHSYGGYFMWPPGAYKTANRETLPRPDAGTEEYYWAASERILSAVQAHRGTAIWPGNTGPVIDVLYSAAGNSADEHWYNRGIFGWDFEVGADLWNASTGQWEAVGFQPPFAEGHEEAMEFAAGQLGILEVALAYGKDTKDPKSQLKVVEKAAGHTDFTFTTNEPATVLYTLDGSRPNLGSAKLQLGGTREGAETLTLTSTATVNWFSIDMAGNVEGNYDPSGGGPGYRSKELKVKPTR